MFKLTTNQKTLFYIIASIFFSLPIAIYGINDIEDYSLGLLSAKIIYNEFNFFIFFYDLYGPGVKFPIGQGIFFHPLIIFLGKINFFYFFFILIHIFLQINYFSKILKQFKIFSKEIVPILLVIFSISNFNYIYSDDWISLFYSYSLLFVSFYYLNKIFTKDSLLAYIQFTISMSLMILNGHAGLIFLYLFFFLLYGILNKKYSFIFKKIPYIFLLILIFILSEYIYWLIEDYLSYNTSTKNIQTSYSIQDYLLSLVSPLFPIIGYKLNNILDMNFHTNRLPSYGILFFLSLIYGSYLFIKKKSFEINYLNILLIILTLLSLTNITSYLYIIAGIWQIRDVMNLISIIILAKFLTDIKLFKLTKYLINSVLFLILVIFFTGNILINTSINLKIKNFIFKNYPEISEQIFHKSNFKIQSSNNFIINDPENIDFLQILEKLNKNNDKFNRVYLSPIFYNLVTNKTSPLRKYGIYGPSDFLKFNLINFNVPLKNSSLEAFAESDRKFYSENTPYYADINNNLYLNIFKIKYLIISSEEFSEIDNKSLFTISNQIILNNIKFFILKYRYTNLSAVVTDYDISEISKLDECEINLRTCINKINELNLYSYLNNIEIKRVGLNEYTHINNNLININIISPFIYNKNWNYFNNSTNLGRYLQTIKVNSNQKETIKYFDTTRYILKLISIISFCILLMFLIKIKIRNLT